MISAEQVTLLESSNSDQVENTKDSQELAIEELPDWSGESDEKRKSEKDDFTQKQADATVLKAEAVWTGAIQWGDRDHDKYYEERRFCEEVEKRQVKDPKAMFEDPEFPAEGKSMYHDPQQPYEGINMDDVVWLRPNEFATAPKLFVDGISPGDVVQGALSDCWILSAIAIASTYPKLVSKLFASTKGMRYGLYVCRFYKDGAWVTVIVDDRIPCDKHSKKPIFASCKDPNEYWVMILEKAYAKLHGCWEALNGGEIDYGLRDLTGGQPHEIDLSVSAVQEDIASGSLWDTLTSAISSGKLILLGAAILNEGGGVEGEAGQGLFNNHAYSILNVSHAIEGKVLLQMRNPWGKGEWTGAWSDQWDGWNPEYKKLLQYVDEDDGTFWMETSDFASAFTVIYVCDIIPDSWNVMRLKGEWKGSTAGGCMNNKATWSNNPAFKMEVNVPAMTHFVLTQPDSRLPGYGGTWNEYESGIGFVIYKSDNGKPKKKLRRKDLITMTPAFKKDREVSLMHQLEPGITYFLIPSSFDANMESTFVLTVTSNACITVSGGEVLEPEEEILTNNEVEELVEAFAEGDAGAAGAQAAAYEISKELTSKQGKRHPLEDMEEALAKECHEKGVLFEDKEFLANGAALYLNPHSPPDGAMPPEYVRWCRFNEICKRPSLFVDGVEPGDVIQGQLSDCWILSAMSIVATDTVRLKRMFVSNKYADIGLYVVRFFKNGEWMTIIVDDRIPCDPSGQPLYATSKDPNETWVMLLEKAYAKIHGCYEALSGGQTDYGLRDLTSGVPHNYNLGERLPGSEKKPEAEARLEMLDEVLKDVADFKSKGHNILTGCAIVDNSGTFEEDTGMGLLSNHAYSVTDMKRLDVDGDGTPENLIRVRNPWGRGEWTGDWSDKWSGWTPELKEKLDFKDEDDGTFWMRDVDFAQKFTDVYVCDIIPQRWSKLKMKGEWRGETAGGCMNNRATWPKNPHFKLTVNTTTSLFVMLMQQDARMGSGETWNMYPNTIGFVVYKSEKGPKKRLRKTDLVATSGAFQANRETTCKLTLAAGQTYYIVPSTFQAGAEGEFFLLVVSDVGVNLEGGTLVKEDSGEEFTKIFEDQMKGSKSLEFDQEMKMGKSDNSSEVDDNAVAATATTKDVSKLCAARSDSVKSAIASGDRASFSVVQHSKFQVEKSFAAAVLRERAGESSPALAEFVMFEDSEFKAEMASIYFDPLTPYQDGPEADDIVWLRPPEFCGFPELFKDGVEPGDVIQGQLNDCWFLSALSILANYPKMLAKLFASSSNAHLGLYVCQFCKNGVWETVIVDDRIPFSKKTQKPVFARCKDTDEIWVLILEKAYAKLHGCYEALDGGEIDYALRDITGGQPHEVDLTIDSAQSASDGNIFSMQESNSAAGHTILLGTAIVEQGTDMASEGANGLLTNHAYSILRVSRDVQDTVLLQLRNPWGEAGEWTGDWSDKWDGWKNHEDKKAILDYKDANDGTFWMAAPDLIKSFSVLYICDIVPKTWSTIRLSGEWKGESAGGCMNNRKTWGNNPVFKFTASADGPVHAQIVLTQPDARLMPSSDPKTRNQYGHAIGFVIYKAENGKAKRRLKKNDSFVMTPAFKKDREVSLIMSLDPDMVYYLVPSTYNANEESTFFVTMATDTAITVMNATAIAEDVLEDIPESEALIAMSYDQSDGKKSPELLAALEQAQSRMQKQMTQTAQRHRKAELEEKYGEECIRSKKLFEDPDFKAENKSLYMDPSNPPAGADQVQWLRPAEISGTEEKNIQLFKDGVEAGDVVQGGLADCWILSALSILATHPMYLQRLFVSTKYAEQGLYVMKFYKNGRWMLVIVDDRIPCDEYGVPLYARGNDPNELWVMILEKAYAKLHGCYEALGGGVIDYGLRDLTGGEPNQISLTPDMNLWQEIMCNGTDGHIVLLGASMVNTETTVFETETPTGLLENHAYSILNVVEYDVESLDPNAAPQKETLFKVRNPWGRTEWQGAWSDFWEGWTTKSKQDLGWFGADDGCFYMNQADFCKHFTDMYVCDILPMAWKRVRVSGAWETGVNAGGCLNNKATWHTNPNYKFTVDAPADVIISLSQKDVRLKLDRNAGYDENAYAKIGFVLYQSDNGNQKRKLRKKDLVKMSGSFQPSREVTVRVKLQPNVAYFVVPSTYEPDVGGEFYITLSSDVTATFADLPEGVEAHNAAEDGADSKSSEVTLAATTQDYDLPEASEGTYENREPDDTMKQEFQDDEFMKRFYNAETKNSKEAAKTFWQDSICKPPKAHVMSDLEAQIASSIVDGQMFEDSEFPATLESMYFDITKPLAGLPEVVWLRPSEMPGADNPSLFKNGIDSEDAIGLQTGLPSHMWFVSCAAIVAGDPQSLKDLFVSDKYSAKGIYVVKFYKDSTWKYLIVDDRIPCDAATKLPIFAACADPNECWINILMKGYAKLHGCYEALNEGDLCYGLGDMTGANAFDLQLENYKKEMESGELWQDMMDSIISESPCLLGCEIQTDSEAAVQCGLTPHVSYSILSISNAISGTWLLHLHNPWGGEEWNGAWSDTWDGWKKSPIYKEKLHYKAAKPGEPNDGTFWIDAQDFAKHFTALHACPVIPDAWSQIRFRQSEWLGDFAGGYQAATWGKNPSFKLTVRYRTTGVLTLSQPDARFTDDHRSGKRKWDEYPNQIGMIIYKTGHKSQHPQMHVSEQWFQATSDQWLKSEFMQSSLFVNGRSTSIILEQPLEPGEAYYVVPCTNEPNQEGTFYLTMASEQMVTISAANEAPEEDKSVNEEWYNASSKVVIVPECKYQRARLMLYETQKRHSLHEEEEDAFRMSSFDHHWEDTEFPADFHSLYYDIKDLPSNAPEAHQIEWKRPHQIAKKPVLMHEHGEFSEIMQGILADCWLLSSVAMIASQPELLKKLFVSTKYANLGIYVVQFWKNGEWVPVLVDDRIPCNIQTGEPLYARCNDPNEIWLLILEKAYAKLHHCYQALSKGRIEYGLKDLSGGAPLNFKNFRPKDGEKDGVWTNLIQRIQKGHHVTVGLQRDDQSVDFKPDVGLGILGNHGYIIEDMQYVGSERLFRVRNPWGRLEWTGKWSDEWSGWTDELKVQLDWKDEDDGRFWMSYDDIKAYFSDMYICDILPQSWTRIRVAGCWQGMNAGGNTTFESWKNNPCYKVTVDMPTDIVVSISQNDGRMNNDKNWNRRGYSTRKPIGFVIYKRVGSSRQYKGLNARNEKDIIAKTIFSDARDVPCDVGETLVPFVEVNGEKKPVTYFIVPSTFYPKEELTYQLHVLSSVPLNFHGDISAHHVFTGTDTHIVDCTMALGIDIKTIPPGSAERAEFVKQLQWDIAALSPLVPEQVKVDVDNIRVPGERLEAVQQLLATSQNILVDFSIPESDAVALNALVLDPRSQLYAQQVTEKCNMKVLPYKSKFAAMTPLGRIEALKAMPEDDRAVQMFRLSKEDRRATLSAMTPDDKLLGLDKLQKVQQKSADSGKSEFDMDEMQKRAHESGLKKQSLRDAQREEAMSRKSTKEVEQSSADFSIDLQATDTAIEMPVGAFGGAEVSESDDEAMSVQATSAGASLGNAAPGVKRGGKKRRGRKKIRSPAKKTANKGAQAESAQTAPKGPPRAGKETQPSVALSKPLGDKPAQAAVSSAVVDKPGSAEIMVQSQLDALTSEIARLEAELKQGETQIEAKAAAEMADDEFPVLEEPALEMPTITEDGELTSEELAMLKQHPDVLVSSTANRVLTARRAEAELVSRKKKAQVALDEALVQLASESESLLKIQDLAAKEADAGRTSLALETQSEAMMQEVKVLRLEKETLTHQIKTLNAEMQGHQDVLEGMKMERGEIETQLKRSESNIHESIQIKERLMSELQHVEQQAANEQLWHQKIEAELAHTEQLRQSGEAVSSQLSRASNRSISRGRVRPKSAAATARRSAGTKSVHARPTRKPRPEPQPPPVRSATSRRPQSANATRRVPSSRTAAAPARNTTASAPSRAQAATRPKSSRTSKPSLPSLSVTRNNIQACRNEIQTMKEKRLTTQAQQPIRGSTTSKAASKQRSRAKVEKRLAGLADEMLDWAASKTEMQAQLDALESARNQRPGQRSRRNAWDD